VQAYNCQAVVDEFDQIVVAQEVTNEPKDMQRLEPMVRQVKANTGRQAKELSADAGYCCESNLRVLERHHIRGYVATAKDEHDDSSAKGKPARSRQDLTLRMARRLRKAGWFSRYRKRKTLSEPVFGQIKQARGFRQFLMRGLRKVAGEWSLLCTAHNLLKLHGWSAAPA